MRYVMSQELSSKIDKLIIEGVQDLNIYIPDGNIMQLVDYVKKKIKWIVVFNLRYTLINYIEDSGYCFTDIGDALYRLLDYTGDDCKTKSKESTNILTIQIDLVSPIDASSSDVCFVYHKINLNTKGKSINPTELLNIENLLDILCQQKLYEFFSNEFEFILRKGIYDLSIEVNEDIHQDEFKDYDDI